MIICNGSQIQYLRESMIVQNAINAFPPPQGGIKQYLSGLLGDNREYIFWRSSDIINQYLEDVKSRLRRRRRDLLLYNPNRGIERPPALPAQEELNERERIEEQEWQRDFEIHFERDRDRDRPLRRNRFARVHTRRIVIAMQGNRNADFMICDNRVRLMPEGRHIDRRWRAAHHLTWHHAENIRPFLEGNRVVFYCDMYLIYWRYHAGRYHDGGCSEYREYTGCRYN